MSGIVVLGALHHDVVVDAPRMPRLDETLPGTRVDYRFGGKGGNQALAAARMGAQVAMAGRVGRDSAAGTIRAAMDEAGVEHSLVLETDLPTGMSVAITLPSGEYAAVTVPGANLENDGNISWREPPLAGLLQNEIPEAANLAFASHLPPDSLLIANAAPARRLPVELAERIDVLIVNLIEAKGLSGHNNPEAALTALAGMVRGAVVLTRGAKGAILLENGQMTHHPAFSTKVVSTHGAGDMFTGAFAARIIEGVSFKSALRFAQAAAGLLVSSPIDRRSEVTHAGVEAFLACR
ncbi:MAG: ribokinase [Boseongicola sp. SB0673_bin_14]|nr:ribokinase [Boseongicola sp. SB0667_bin_21]MYI67245.1 ribokinase [Boseongicola sp. SB0673_bin_14]